MRQFAWLAAVVAVLLTGVTEAADPAQLLITAVEEQPGRITLVVSTTGKDGQALTGLTAANFRAELDGAQLNVSNVQLARASRSAAAVLLLVDVSGSMLGEPMEQAKRALQEFVKALEPVDSVALMAFDSRVTPLQDFTTDRNLINQAIARLTPRGDTALYDSVLEASRRVGAPSGRKMIVLLSDGEATVGREKREQSLQAAREAGVAVVTLGLGASIDRAYLGELAAATGGRFLEAPTPASLRQAYLDLAGSLRNQHEITLVVPASVDRSVAGKLSLHFTSRTETAVVERLLEPLPGAVPPAFSLTVSGITPNQRLEGATTLSLAPPEGVTLTRVEYSLDGGDPQQLTTAPFQVELQDGLAPGPHILRIIAVDQRGRQTELQVPFQVAVASDGGSLPVLPLGVAVLALGLAAGVMLVSRRRNRGGTDLGDRVKPFTRRVAEPVTSVEGWQVARPERVAKPQVEQPLGRVVLMNEEALRGGQLDSIREFDLYTAPLTLGTGSTCDIQLDDDEGRIAAEEARLWVQRRRLVFHKLTTLSAMATEGITSGWEFLESGEELRVGPYRLLFQVIERAPEPDAAAVPGEAQESLAAMPLSDLWSRLPEGPSGG